MISSINKDLAVLHLLDIPSKFRNLSIFRNISAQQYIIQMYMCSLWSFLLQNVTLHSRWYNDATSKDFFIKSGIQILKISVLELWKSVLT